MLYQADTDVLFPPRVIPTLADLRGPTWRDLVDHILSLPEDHPDVLGFMMLMVRLNSCITCHADSYRAMRGCTFCARQSVARFKGTDEDLIELWNNARQEVLHWLETGILPDID